MAIPNGAYTIQNTKSGEWRTFEVKTKRGTFATGERVVSLLVGSDNCSDYKGFGFVKPEGILVWRKVRGEAGKPSAFEVYANMIWSLATKGEGSAWFQRGYRLMIEKRCMRCNRRLTTPESIEAGIGPECAGR